MRILFLTNFYAPYGFDGHEQWSQTAVEALRNRGHEVRVLTSQHGRHQNLSPEPTWIVRELHLEMDLTPLWNGLQFFTHRHAREQENLNLLRTHVSEFRPDVILIGDMWNIVRTVPALAERLLPGRVVYYLCNYWPLLPSQFEFFWKAPARHWYTQLPKALLAQVARRLLARQQQPRPRFDRVIIPAAFIQTELMQHGIVPLESQVIHNGVNPELYRHQNDKSDPAQTSQPNNITLLYIGTLRADKGVHTAIKALARLVNEHQQKNLKLLIAGKREFEYTIYLEYLIRRYHLEPYITFVDHSSTQTAYELYHQADILLFTSARPDPFDMVLMEAMAARVPIIGSTVDGAIELLTENENALTFPPGDADALARQVARLSQSLDLRQRFAAAGEALALKKFDMRHTITQIETYLIKVAG